MFILSQNSLSKKMTEKSRHKAGQEESEATDEKMCF